jgi:N-acetyl-gamma-glutamyl-phosphate reductase
MSQLRVGIAGATGYLGTELLRHLLAHPQAKVVKLASASKAGRPTASSFPTFGHLVPREFTGASAPDLADVDLVFAATPSCVARALAPDLLAAGVKLVDLSGDHRLSPGAAIKHYGAAPLATGAVYGLPEVNAGRIRTAKLVANPGCYPTASALALLPLVQQRLVEPALIVDALSGVSGAGKEPSETHHFPEQNESASAYKVGTHRHQPEIAETLTGAGGWGVHVAFTPHVVPMNRGILATAYATAKGAPLTGAELMERYHKAYADEPFAKVVEFEPDTKHVRNTNYAHVKPHANGSVYVVTSAIDNLVKGGAGQAIENMNLMSGFERTLGLPILGGGP